MGVIQLQGGTQDGEFPLNMTDSATGAHPYYGGQPATVDANGARLALSADSAKVVGVFKVSSFEDRKTGLATILSGVCRLKFINGSVSQDNTDGNGNTVEGAAYDTSVLFATGDYIYVSSTGKWTNTGSAGAQKGLVIKGQNTNDDSVEVYFFPQIVA